MSCGLDHLAIPFINERAAEELAGALRCEYVQGKGRTLNAARNFEQGDIVLSEEPLHVVREVPGDPLYDQLVELCASSKFVHCPRWYWCMINSLTPEDLGQASTWTPIDKTVQRNLLLLHQGEFSEPCKDMSVIAAALLPPGADLMNLERCLQAWLHNAWTIQGQRTGLVIYFLASLISHSCNPSLVVHQDSDGNMLLRARHKICSGDEITVSYLPEVELLDAAPKRRRDLWDSKRFWCSCERCIGEEDKTRGLRCDTCKEGFVFPKLPELCHAQKPCPKRAKQILRPLRPANYDEVSAQNLELWLTIGAPELQRDRGKFYYEVKLGSGTDEPQIGWATLDFAESEDWTGSGVGDDEHSWAADGMRKRLWHNGDADSVEWSATWHDGDIVGCAVDIDAGIMRFAINGMWEQAANIKFDPKGHPIFPALSMQGDFAFCFDSQTFEFKPPHATFLPLLPAGAASGVFNRSMPLYEVFAGAICCHCGTEVSLRESKRLCNLEDKLQCVLATWEGTETASTRAQEANDLVCETGPQHYLGFRVREYLAHYYYQTNDHAAQVHVLSDICIFTASAFLGLHPAHADALASHADALVEGIAPDGVKKKSDSNSDIGDLKQALTLIKQAYFIHRTIYGTDCTETVAANAKIQHVEELLEIFKC